VKKRRISEDAGMGLAMAQWLGLWSQFEIVLPI
jgi:hypothetical protein